MNIDILDDDPLEHLIMEKMLSLMGGLEHITHSSDGRKLLMDIQMHSYDYNALPDVIFVDIHMPNMSGWAFLDEFEKIEPSLKKKVQLYILSSSIDPGDISRSKNYPFVRDYLFKPVGFGKLKAALNINVDENHR